MKKSELIKKADEIFSIYIRLKYADANNRVKCYTCPEVLQWMQITNGHFLGRSYMGTRFEERSCRPQCSGCQGRNNGERETFRAKLVDEYGELSVQAIEIQSKRRGPDRFEIEEKLQFWKEEIVRINGAR